MYLHVKFLQIIMAKPAGGPKAPKQQGHWDKDDWKDEPEKQYAVSSVSSREVSVCEHMHEYTLTSTWQISFLRTHDTAVLGVLIATFCICAFAKEFYS